MELKKRILSAVILITVLGSGMYLGAKDNKENLAREEANRRMELYKVINDLSADTVDDMELATLVSLDRLANEKSQEDVAPPTDVEEDVSYFEKLLKSSDVLTAYNSYLKDFTDSDIVLTEDDIAYLASLDNFKNASVVAIKSPITNHYNTVYTGDYIMVPEDGDALITRLDGVRANYYDTQIDIMSTKELTEEEIAGLVPIGEFIDTNDMEVSGYCFPTFGEVTPSDETLEIIGEVYGEEVVGCVQIFGLPVAYYNAKDFDEALNKQDRVVKGLNN